MTLRLIKKGSAVKPGPTLILRLRPDGARQPNAEAYVLMKFNSQLLGNGPNNDRKIVP